MLANPAFLLFADEAADMRESLRILGRCPGLERAENSDDELTEELPDVLPGPLSPELRERLLNWARQELREVRRQLTFRRTVWEMFWHRDERAIRKQYWRLCHRQRFRDAARVAELLVDVRHSLLEQEAPGRVHVRLDGRNARKASKIVAAITGQCGPIEAALYPTEATVYERPPGPNAKKTRWLPWLRRTPSWQAAYNAACLYAALEQSCLYDQKENLVTYAVTSLRRAVNDPECEMDRPSDWISADPDLSQLERWPDFISFLYDQKVRDYPADPITCIFCGEMDALCKINGEYAFLNWSSETVRLAGARPEISCARRNSHAGTADPWPAVEVAVDRLRAVCEPCEVGWMTRLEGAIRPLLLRMIEGSHVELTPEQQSMVAAWAVLKAAVFEHLWTHDPILTGVDREILRTRSRPSAGVRVRLALAEPGRCPLRAQGLVFETRRQCDRAVSVTIAIGRLAATVIGGSSAGMNALQTVDGPGAGLTAVFPPQAGTVGWPPPDALPHESLPASGQLRGPLEGGVTG